ncbi:helix-turn-helix domain-containing protein [Aeromonas sp. A04]|uniref:helix-turn-helix domain-containing protein n=1 Tax=Aeromonas sp. A04 TaxID=3398359 RepID=UPI0039F6B4FA
MELHNEGKSFREIDKALGLGNDTARKFITTNSLPKNALGAKIGTPESSTSAVPMASTEDRSETREDARS